MLNKKNQQPTNMKFIPTLMSTPMVQAQQAGRKSMTRREKGLQKINKNPDDWQLCTVGEAKVNGKNAFGVLFQHKETKEVVFIPCPYGQPGDVLWVRETFAEIEGMYWYKANDDAFRPDKWQPSLFMPKAACRIFLQNTNIRVERLQDISESDSVNEGVEKECSSNINLWKIYTTDFGFKANTAKWSFETLWYKIKGKESWDKNPFVWVVEFTQIPKPTNF